VCEGQLLLCDAETNACVGCQRHEECASGACELAQGTCFDAAGAVHVDGDGGQDFGSISEAVASIDDGQDGVIVVHELDGGLSYQEPVLIDGGKTIALLAAPGESPIVQGTGGNPGLRVEGAGTVLYMEGLELSLAAAEGLVVDEAFTWVDRGRIVQNTGGGVLAQNGAELVLRNCFVGGGAQDVDAIALNDSTLDMLYTTAAGGSVIGGQTRALFCEGGASAIVRNSILVSLDPMPEVECSGVVLTNSATEAETGPLDAVGWFGGYVAGDFLLTMPGADIFRDIAQWQSGDPSTDIDGDLRPSMDATPDYAGADVPL